MQEPVEHDGARKFVPVNQADQGHVWARLGGSEAYESADARVSLQPRRQVRWRDLHIELRQRSLRRRRATRRRLRRIILPRWVECISADT